MTAHDRSRGRLKIFFGYAAGVGKTHAMLEAAHRLAAQGHEVVAGYIEPHGRRAIDALIEGLEALPFLETEHHGVAVREFDLGAALDRKPEILLVDELPHSNPADAVHPKRYQDIEELRRAGIDVWTTLNVQHLDGVHDVVERLTGVSVQELVPDAVFDGADAVEVIDLPPDELLERLERGEVYAPEQARQAVGRFFRRSNLVALRELALRRAAERVRQQGAREGPLGQTGPQTSGGHEQFLVCVSARESMERVLRTGQRMALAFQAPWTVLYVTTPGLQSEDIEAQERINGHLARAKRLGAETAIVSAENVVDGILRYANEHGFTQILVGRAEKPSFRHWFGSSITKRLLGRSGAIDIHVVHAEKDPAHSLRGRVKPHREWRTPLWHWTVLGGSLGSATGVALGFWHLGLAETNIIMAYLAAVVFVATRAPLPVSLAGSALAVLLYDVLFTTPFYTIVVDDIQYVFTFGVMGVVAVTVSSLTARVRRHASLAESQQHRAEQLVRLTQALTAQSGKSRLARATENELRLLFGGDIKVIMPNNEGQVTTLDSSASREQAVAQWVLDNGAPAGHGTDTFPQMPVLCLPLGSAERTLGVLLWRQNGAASGFSPEDLRFLEACAAQVGIALEREQFAQDSRRREVEVETERLRATLLSSVSHDLRTPLATITGSVSSLLDLGEEASSRVRERLLRLIHRESTEMERLIADLVSLSRLESQGDRLLELSWEDPGEVVQGALARMVTRLEHHTVRTDLPDDLPLVAMDPVLIQQVLVNLLENAARYTPTATTIMINAGIDGDVLVVRVADEGPGVPTELRDRIFEKFVRGQSAGPQRGMGIGLSICRAILYVHRGRIWVEDPADGQGAVFAFSLPIQGWPPLPRPQTSAYPGESHQ